MYRIIWYEPEYIFGSTLVDEGEITNSKGYSDEQISQILSMIKYQVWQDENDPGILIIKLD